MYLRVLMYFLLSGCLLPAYAVIIITLNGHASYPQVSAVLICSANRHGQGGYQIQDAWQATGLSSDSTHYNSPAHIEQFHCSRLGGGHRHREGNGSQVWFGRDYKYVAPGRRFRWQTGGVSHKIGHFIGQMFSCVMAAGSLAWNGGSASYSLTDPTAESTGFINVLPSQASQQNGVVILQIAFAQPTALGDGVRRPHLEIVFSYRELLNALYPTGTVEVGLSPVGDISWFHPRVSDESGHVIDISFNPFAVTTNFGVFPHVNIVDPSHVLFDNNIFINTEHTLMISRAGTIGQLLNYFVQDFTLWATLSHNNLINPTSNPFHNFSNTPVLERITQFLGRATHSTVAFSHYLCVSPFYFPFQLPQLNTFHQVFPPNGTMPLSTTYEVIRQVGSIIGSPLLSQIMGICSLNTHTPTTHLVRYVIRREHPCRWQGLPEHWRYGPDPNGDGRPGSSDD